MTAHAAPLHIVISASNAFADWMQLDLARMPSADGKNIGTQTLITNASTVAWQCHALKHRPRDERATLIAIEAHSRYTIIIPNQLPQSCRAFEDALLHRWGNEAIQLALNAGAIHDLQARLMADNFMKMDLAFHWARNTDLSVNGHVADCSQWLLDNTPRGNVTALNDNQAYSLALHINQFFKRTKHQGKKVKFYPNERLLADALFRFANDIQVKNTGRLQFPNPYQAIQETQKSPPAPQPMSNNVVSFIDYQNKTSASKKQQ